METIRLRYFCMIAETGSLTKAAEMLGVSHSGLSKAISTLQQETKLKLFRPQGRGLEITPEGKWFYGKALKILQIENEIELGTRKEAPSAVRMGLSEIMAATCCGVFGRELESSVLLIQAEMGEIEDKVISGELDFGITFSPVPKAELEYLELGEVAFNSFGRKDLRERFPEFGDIPFVVPATDAPLNPMGYKSRDGWPLTVPREIKYSVNTFSMALGLLTAGEAAVYMPNFVAALENAKHRQDLPLVKIGHPQRTESVRKIFLVKLKSAEESKEMKKIGRVIRKVCCKMPTEGR